VGVRAIWAPSNREVRNLTLAFQKAIKRYGRRPKPVRCVKTGPGALLMKSLLQTTWRPTVRVRWFACVVHIATRCSSSLAPSTDECARAAAWRRRTVSSDVRPTSSVCWTRCAPDAGSVTSALRHWSTSGISRVRSTSAATSNCRTNVSLVIPFLLLFPVPHYM